MTETPPATNELAGRLAVVTGASRGIGAAIATTLARHGASLALVARSEQACADTRAAVEATGTRSITIAADLADPQQSASVIPTAVAEFGGVDILINNAGQLPAATRAERLSLEEWDRVIALNLSAPWSLAARAHPSMAARGGGVVVNVTSTAAYYPSVGLAHYCSSKAALEMTTKVLALEWARDNIRVLGVAPGRIETSMIAPILEYDRKLGRAPNPLNRLGRPADVAETIAFLCSDRAAYLTGTTIIVDGGELVGLAAATPATSP